MFNTIEDYLDALKKEMKGNDIALQQDALADAREHLFMALEAIREEAPNMSEAEALQRIIEDYGTPEETASAYREIERRTSPSLKQVKRRASFFERTFSVYADPRTWGALLFMVISFITGFIYFAWVFVGLSLSLMLMILIIGVPFAILFLISVWGLALLEGRLVEALLNVRMPRRPLFIKPGMKWSESLKALATNKHTWLSMLYMLLQWPLGFIYFSLVFLLIAGAMAAMATPFVQVLMHIPVVTLGNGPILLPFWALTLIEIGGLVLLTITMHLIRGTGRLHGRYAKRMLVG